MPMSANCPDAAILTGYARNDLPQPDATSVEAHLGECEECLTRYLELGRQSPAPQIPDCHFVREVGRGRFGVVYKAWWTRGRPRIVALKLLTCPSEMERNRFEREVSVLKKLDSPSIVKCLDAGTAGDAVYYVMDYVDGVHLDEYLKQSSHSLEDQLDVFAQVCRAVADAHTMGVVHRDLKPRNILIDDSGKPHVLDFGICSVDSMGWSSAAQRTITHPGDLIGTLRYMSPEQAWGGAAGAIDERSDIWALGVMLYEIVTGGDYPYSLEPMPDKSIHEALLERIRKELPKLPRLNSIPRGADLEILLSRSLAWELNCRMSSAEELSDDLRRYVQGKRIKTRPLRLPYRIKRLAVGAATRSRWTFAAMFVAAIALSLWVSALSFDVGWRVTGRDYPGASGSYGTFAEPGRTRDGIVIAGVFDKSVASVVEYATRQGIPDVTPTLTSWRGVHGHLMKRLASARPRAVIWDYYFRTPQAADAELVAGIRALERAGTPVALAALTHREDGTPDLSAGITEPLGRRLRSGAIIARDMIKRPGEFPTVFRRSDGVVVQSLALTTLAAMLHPETHLELEWHGRNRWLEALYELKPGAFLRERDRIEFTKVFEQQRSTPVAKAGDLLACNTFELERPERWEQRTVAYETLLTCSDARLRELVENKLIIVGDLRMPRFGFRPDRHPVKYGHTVVEDVPGCYLLADAIAGLLDRRYFKAAFPPSTSTFLYTLALAVIGCALPIRLAALRVFERPKPRQAACVGLMALTAGGLVLMTTTDDVVSVHGGMAAFAIFAAMTGSFWVEFARNRHRIADRNRRAMESLDLSGRGTVTLPLKRPMPLQETG